MQRARVANRLPFRNKRLKNFDLSKKNHLKAKFSAGRLAWLGDAGSPVKKTNILVLLLVFTVSLAANSSLLGTYYFADDDYFQFDKSITYWFATRGIWRIIGIPLPGWLVSREIYALALIAAHAIGGYFFFLVARRAFGSVAHALLLTIIAMAFPWGYEGLVWASAAGYVFASCLLWVILWTLLSLRADQRQIYVCARGLLFGSFLCLLIHEALFFLALRGGFHRLDAA